MTETVMEKYQRLVGELAAEGLNALHDSQPEAGVYIGRLLHEGVARVRVTTLLDPFEIRIEVVAAVSGESLEVARMKEPMQ
jgi:hypothetical protein